jgi:hypothetical protein
LVSKGVERLDCLGAGRSGSVVASFFVHPKAIKARSRQLVIRPIVEPLSVEPRPY